MNSLQVIKVRRVRDNYYTAVNTIEKKRREHPTRAKAEKNGINIARKKNHHVSFSMASFSDFFFIALTTKEPVRITDFIAQQKKEKRARGSRATHCLVRSAQSTATLLGRHPRSTGPQMS